MKQKPSSPKPFHYVELRQELDDILVRLQTTELDIDQSMMAYKRGVEIVTQLEAHLAEVENVVTPLKAEADEAQED